MSNSIWKKPTVRPVKDCIVVWQNPAHMSFTLPRTVCKYMERYNCERWATLDDIIAQADKAERLQKAVDLAIHSFNEIRAGVPNDKWVFDEATKATNKIEQLTKGTTNDK